MGSTSSAPSSNLPISSSQWVVVDEAGIPKLYHNSDGLIAQECVFALDHSLKLDKQLQIYNYRKNQKLSLVSVYGVQSNTGLIEHFPQRLKERNPYSFQESLYILSELLPACKDILKKLGPVIFQDTMIGITALGHVKIWVNPHFQLNHPAQIHRSRKNLHEAEKDMTISFLKVIQKHVIGGRYPQQFINPLITLEHISLVNLQRYIQQFADAKRVIIPDRLQQVTLVQEKAINTLSIIQQLQQPSVEQAYLNRNSQGTIIINTSVLQSPHVNQQTDSPEIVRAIRPTIQPIPVPVNTQFQQSVHPIYSQPPLISQPYISEIFPRYSANPLPNQSNFSKNLYSTGSLLTADRTGSHMQYQQRYNSLSAPIYNSINPIPPVSIFQNNTAVKQSYQRPINNTKYPLFQIAPTLPFADSLAQQTMKIDLPPSELNYSPQRTLPPRTSLPSPINFPVYPALRLQPMSLPIQLNRQQIRTSYITPIKSLITQDKQQDIYLTTTTYKINQNFTCQYRTTHPESVILLSNPNYNPQVTRVKLPRISPNISQPILNQQEY